MNGCGIMSFSKPRIPHTSPLECIGSMTVIKVDPGTKIECPVSGKKEVVTEKNCVVTGRVIHVPPNIYDKLITDIRLKDDNKI